MKNLVIAICLIFLLAACEAEPTPFPVELPPTPEPTLAPTAIPAVRYGLDANTAGFVPDLAEIEARAVLFTEAMNPADLGARFDLIAAYGSLDGWLHVPQTPTVTLIVNPAAVSPEVVSIILRGVDPGAVVTGLGIPGAMVVENLSIPPDDLLNELANLGSPDGLGLAMGVTYIPGASMIQAQLAAININTRIVMVSHTEIEQAFANNQIQLALISWTDTPPDLFSVENMINLYRLPISYLAVDGLNISFTRGGFPIGAWE